MIVGQRRRRGDRLRLVWRGPACPRMSGGGHRRRLPLRHRRGLEHRGSHPRHHRGLCTQLSAQPAHPAGREGGSHVKTRPGGSVEWCALASRSRCALGPAWRTRIARFRPRSGAWVSRHGTVSGREQARRGRSRLSLSTLAFLAGTRRTSRDFAVRRRVPRTLYTPEYRPRDQEGPRSGVEGVDAELTEIGGRDPLRHRRSRASPLRQWHAPRSGACHCLCPE